MSEKERLSYAITLDTSQLEASAQRASNEFKNMGSNIENESRRIDNSLKMIGTAAAAYFSVTALNDFARSIIQARGEIESLEISFSTLLGSTDKAKELFGAIREFEVKTPMTLEPLAKGAQTLLGFGIAAEKVMPILRQIGDISMGNAERFQSLILAFAQASANGKLMGQDLLQMINAGFNPLNQMAKDTGKSIAELRDEMSQGSISAADMEKAFASATAEGGQFYGMLEKQSEGINGALSNLEGAWNSMLNDIGSKQQSVFVSGVNMVTGLVENYEVFMNAILSVAAAYGTYKAVLMALWVVEKTRNISENIRLVMMFRKELGLLTAAQQAFNITAWANPYVLLAAAIVGVVAALVLFTDNTSNAEEAQAKLNQESDEYRKKLDEQRKSIEQYINVIRDKTETEYSQIAAYERLKTICPELTNEYSMQEIATANLADTTKKLNEIQEQQDYEHKISELNKYKALLEDISNAGNSWSKLSKENADLLRETFGHGLLSDQQEKVQEYVNGLQKDIDEINRLRKEAEYNALPIETKLEFAIKDRDKIKSEFEQVKKEFEEQQKKAENQFNVWNVDIFLNLRFKNLQESLKSADAKVESLKSQKASQTTFKQDYEAAKKAWKDAKSELDKINKDRENYTSKQYKDAKAAYDTAEKAFKDLGGDTKENKNLKKSAEERKKILEDIAKQRKQLLNDISDAETSAMQEGLRKRLQEIENQRVQTLSAIDREETELANKLAKVGRKLSSSDRQGFQAKRDATNAIAVQETRKAEEENAEYIKGLYENLADVFVSEEERKINAIRQTYNEQRKQLGKDLSGGNISQEQYNDLSSKINAAEAKEMTDYWLSTYGTYYQKREQLTREWESRISQIPAEFQEEAIRQYKAALSSLDIEANKSTSAISQMFGDMKDKTLAELEAINKRGQDALDFLKSGQWDAKKGADLGISKETFDTWSKSPEKLKDISDALIDNKRAADELRPALDKVVKGLQTLFNSGNDSKKLKQALSDIQSGLGEITQVGGFLSDTFSSLGEAFGSDTLSGIADGINVAMDAVNSAMQGAQAGAMFGPIGAAAGAAIGVVSSLASSIAQIHDKKNEARIQKLQDQIDLLDRSYDNLGRSIEKAYSTDASKLIEQQNTLLEQQKVLIQQQIREEQDKKDSDDGRIKEWQQQIEDINNLIEDNKEKAKDAIFGEDIQSAIDDFAQAYIDAWAAGDDKVKASKDLVKDMIKQMITEAMKATISPDMERLRETMLKFWSDGFISDWEQDYLDRMAQDMTNKLENQYGWADDYFKEEEEETEREGTKKGIATASQESVDENNARLTTIQGHTFSIVEGLGVLNATANKMLEHLAGIESNTSETNEKLDNTNAKIDDVEKKISKMSGTLEDINTKGLKLKK